MLWSLTIKSHNFLSCWALEHSYHLIKFSGLSLKSLNSSPGLWSDSCLFSLAFPEFYAYVGLVACGLLLFNIKPLRVIRIIMVSMSGSFLCWVVSHHTDDEGFIVYWLMHIGVASSLEQLEIKMLWTSRWKLCQHWFSFLKTKDLAKGFLAYRGPWQDTIKVFHMPIHFASST